MRIDALEDQETGFQCGDADDNDEGRCILFYFFSREIYIFYNEETQKIYWRFYYEKEQFDLCMGT